MKLRRALTTALPSALLLQALACGSGGPVLNEQEEAAWAASAIIGGFPAESSALEAVGAIGGIVDGVFDPFCTGTLIQPNLILTAKHCASDQGTPLLEGQRLYFATGPDVTGAEHFVEINGAWLSPESEGGLVADFVGYGNDVALLHLIRPIEGVQPIPFSRESLTSEDLGKKFISVGYGVREGAFGSDGEVGERQMGVSTLRALEGKYFEHIFGSKEAFLQHEAERYGAPLEGVALKKAEATYELSILLPGYDAWLGHSAGDVQACKGDSGGPLLRQVTAEAEDGTTTSELRVFGVVSAGWHSKELRCDYGTWYALLGPKMQELLAWAVAYEDPCQGTTPLGTCEGTVATRCTMEPGEGQRRKTAMDCSLLSQVCGLDEEQRATCVAPSPPSPGPRSLHEGPDALAE